MPNAKTYIVNDQATETDALDFTPYVETLADIIQTGNTPLTIGVFGTWGSGKTSLMRMVKKQLPDDFTVAWFDAWKYDKEETLWRAFLLNVLLAVEEKSGETEELKKLKTMLYRGLELEKTGGVTIDLAKLGAQVAEGAIQIGLSFIPPLAALTDLAKELQKAGRGKVEKGFEDAIRRERTKIYVEQVRSLEQFQEKFATLMQSYISPNRLVVFVDDLDRCLPEKSIQVLEAIKLFLDVKDCVFILGVDQDVIARGIEMKYREFRVGRRDDGQQRFAIEGIKYLEKIIQLPFQIPPIAPTDLGRFVDGLSAEWPDDECPRVFAEGLGDNPRQIKRTVNTFLMLWKLADKRKAKLQDRIKPIRLAKVVAIQAVYPDIYNLLLKEEPRYLRDLEDFYRSEKTDSRTQEDEAGEEITQPVEPLPALVPFLAREGAAAVRRILLHQPQPTRQDADFTGLSSDEIKLYFTLTRQVEARHVTPSTDSGSFILEPQMVSIPAGQFLLGSTGEQASQAAKSGLNQGVAQWEQPQRTIELSDFLIGKYPITMREYQMFVRDANYPSPRGWDGDQFPKDKGDHPVVLVSWEDAIAYCKWLSKRSGKKYRLPTEAQWEKAARGTEGQIWSWGNQYEPNRANTEEEGIGDTTPVGHYSPQGDSPYGCADMNGNVSEWCGDWFMRHAYHQIPVSDPKDPQGPGRSERGDARAVRGGSFLCNSIDARCTRRFRQAQRFRNEDIGFRVVLLESRESEV